MQIAGYLLLFWTALLSLFSNAKVGEDWLHVIPSQIWTRTRFRPFPCNTSNDRKALVTRCCLPYARFIILFTRYLTSNSEMQFPFSFSKPTYYFPSQKINSTLFFKHWSLKFSQLRGLLLKEREIYKSRVGLRDCRGPGSLTGSDYGRCSG